MKLIDRIILIVRAWWNHKKELAKPPKKKHPVEIFPELAYWKVGDDIQILDMIGWGLPITYKGIDNKGILVFYGFSGDIEKHKIKGNTFRNRRIAKKKADDSLSNSEYMKDISRFQELIKKTE